MGQAKRANLTKRGAGGYVNHLGVFGGKGRGNYFLQRGFPVADSAPYQLSIHVGSVLSDMPPSYFNPHSNNGFPLDSTSGLDPWLRPERVSPRAA